MDTPTDTIIRIPDFRDRFEQRRNGQPITDAGTGRATFLDDPTTPEAAGDLVQDRGGRPLSGDQVA